MWCYWTHRTVLDSSLLLLQHVVMYVIIVACHHHRIASSSSCIMHHHHRHAFLERQYACAYVHACVRVRIRNKDISRQWWQNDHDGRHRFFASCLCAVCAIVKPVVAYRFFIAFGLHKEGPFQHDHQWCRLELVPCSYPRVPSHSPSIVLCGALLLCRVSRLCWVSVSFGSCSRKASRPGRPYADPMENVCDMHGLCGINLGLSMFFLLGQSNESNAHADWWW